ncbi:hypothetical protein BR93DRAFT_947505 [Coniochaeta sp. PMI_546]|nr:hypothetical protein BR93DRAFT_947505 [Coniochaeta sp. PMI_546]
MRTPKFAKFRPNVAEYETVYRHLHQNPELSMLESDTAHLAEAHLEKLGLNQLIGNIGGHGIVGVLRNGCGPAVLLRADMDALPIKELTRLLYASTKTQIDRLGRRTTVVWDAYCLFQPGEEDGAGARKMVEDGLFDKIPKPDVLLGQQVVRTEAGTVQLRSGPALSACDCFDVRLFRKAINIVPETVDIKVDVRAYEPVVRERVVGAVKRVIRSESEASGLLKQPEISQTDDIPALINDDTLVKGLEVDTGSDDFSIFAEAGNIPCMYWNIGGVDPSVSGEGLRDISRGTIRGLSPDLGPAV